MARLLILTGGAYHDFDAFKDFAARVFDDFDIRFTHDPSAVADPNADVVLIYTCYLDPPSDPSGTYTYLEGISDADSASLAEWVREGGGLLALHSATTIRESNVTLRRLFGGRFTYHPPRCPVTVYPVATGHPMTDDVEAFTVFDELYQQEYDDVDVHMVAIDRGVAIPMAWSRLEGRGRVAHISPGHDENAWRSESYQQLLLRTVAWLGGENTGRARE